MSEITCPYCEKNYELCMDDGWGCAEDQRYEEQCPNCEKKFIFYSSWEVYFSTYKTDCLNNLTEHQWKKIPNHQTIYNDHQLCTICGEDKKGDRYTDEQFNNIFGI